MSQVALQPIPGSGSGISEAEANGLYLVKAGLPGGQEAAGGTLASNNLTLQSTTNATKGKIIIGAGGGWAAFDEVNKRLGIGTVAPTAILQVTGAAAAPFQNAAPALKVDGPAGGVAVEEEAGGEGASASVACGKGGASTVVGFPTKGGIGGGGTFAAGAGGSATGANTTQENQGGAAGGFSFQAGAGGAASNSSTTNLGGKGGNVTVLAGPGGNAEGAVGARKGGNGGEVVVQGGSGGTGSSGGGEGGNVTVEGGTSGGTLAGGRLILKGGQGSGATAGGLFRLTTYKEGVTVGAELEVTAAGEYLFKSAATTRLTLGATGKIGLYASAPVSQAAAITKLGPGPGEAAIVAKVNELVKAIAAGEGGIGISL